MKERRETAGGKAVLVVVLVLVLMVGGGWAAAYHFADDKLPHGTTVAGVDVGDRTPGAAARHLESALAGRLHEPITIFIEGRSVQVDPAAAGLSFDAPATVRAGAATRSWDPRKLWQHYTDGNDLRPVVEVDETKLAAVAKKVDAQAGRTPRSGAVSLRGARVTVTEPVVGRGVDPAKLADALRSAVLATGDGRRVELPLRDIEPAIGESAVLKAVDGFANPAMSAPVTLVFGASSVRIEPQAYASALSLTPKDGALEPTVDRARLRTLVARGLAGGKKAPVDAAVRLVKGRPKVTPGKRGVSYGLDETAKAFLRVVARPDGRRTVRVAPTLTAPTFTTADAKALRITRGVSHFTTRFGYAADRNVDIGRAADLINGTVLEPGETFSLIQTVGERTRANGFATGGTVQGGVSQLATTIFNAAFFAGLQVVEHTPPSHHVARYPVGREATVAWPSVDLRFKNDTRYGVLVHASVTPSTPSSRGSVTVSLWSTKVWDITTRTGARYAFRPFHRRTVPGGDCETTSGADGFSIDVWRYFHRPGSSAVAKTEKLHTTYSPRNRVVCK